MHQEPLVMLIDDDPSATEMYRVGLELVGYRVSVVNDPDALTAALASEVPDIFVLDWELGSITGADVLDRLKSNPRTAAVPVFMVSNFSQDADEQHRVERAGALAWLLKARTTPYELAGRLRQVLPPRPEP